MSTPSQETRERRLVAHRGSPLRVPENTIKSVEAACQSGASFVEIDIQITADGIPILYHDSDQLRVSGRDIDVCEVSSSDLGEASYAERFGDSFSGLTVNTLREFVHTIAAWPQVQCFIEIKSHSLEHFGLAQAMEWVHADIVKMDKDRIAAVIAMSVAALEVAREEWGLPIGWVLPAWNEEHHVIAQRLLPDYIFCQDARFPKNPNDLWQGDWKWVVYPVNEIVAAEAWFEYGLDLVETDDIQTMMAHFGESR